MAVAVFGHGSQRQQKSSTINVIGICTDFVYPNTAHILIDQNTKITIYESSTSGFCRLLKGGLVLAEIEEQWSPPVQSSSFQVDSQSSFPTASMSNSRRAAPLPSQPAIAARVYIN